MSENKSGYNIFDAFSVEDAIANALHGNNCSYYELSPRVSREFNSKVNAVIAALCQKL